MTTPRPSSRAEQRRRTEARILDAAAQVFFAAGYDRATIRAVASAAGVDAGLVMHYFGSKQELFRRVIDAAPVPEVSGAPEQAAEQILAGLADRLASEPIASLTLLRSMLTNPEAASAASAGIARYQEQIAQAIPADDASLRAAIISAITLGVTVSRHLIRSDELASADPAQVIGLLRPCMLALAATKEPRKVLREITGGSRLKAAARGKCDGGVRGKEVVFTYRRGRASRRTPARKDRDGQLGHHRRGHRCVSDRLADLRAANSVADTIVSCSDSAGRELGEPALRSRSAVRAA